MSCDIKQSLPSIEKSADVYNKYKQTIENNRDTLDESPALMMKTLRGPDKIVHIKHRSLNKADNLLLSQRVTNSQQKLQENYLLSTDRSDKEFKLSQNEMEIARLMGTK